MVFALSPRLAPTSHLPSTLAWRRVSLFSSLQLLEACIVLNRFAQIRCLSARFRFFSFRGRVLARSSASLPVRPRACCWRRWYFRACSFAFASKRSASPSAAPTSLFSSSASTHLRYSSEMIRKPFSTRSLTLLISLALSPLTSSLGFFCNTSCHFFCFLESFI